MVTQRAKIVVEGKTSGAVAKLKNVSKATTGIKTSAAAAGVAQEKLGRKLKKTGEAGKFAANAMRALTAGAIIGGVQQLASAIDDAAKRTLQVNAAQQAFTNTFGKSNKAIEQARGATKGLVADYDLMVSANKAATLGVVKNSEEFAKLVDVATRLGAAVGQDATKSVEDLTTALGRQSPMILDNLGITLKVSEAHERYAARIGKTASELTDAEKKQAFMTEAMAAAEEAAAATNVQLDDQAVKVAAASAKWTNFTDDLKKNATVVASETIVAYEGLTDAVGRALRATNDLIGAQAVQVKQGQKSAVQVVFEETEKLQRIEQQRANDKKRRAAAEKAADDDANRIRAQRIKDEARAADEAKKKRTGRGGRRREALSREDVFAGRAAEDVGFEDLQADLAAERQDAKNAALEREIDLRRQRLDILDLELEIAQAKGEDTGNVIAEKMLIEEELTNFERRQAEERGEIAEFEAAQKAAALQKELASVKKANASKKVEQKSAFDFDKFIKGASVDVLQKTVEAGFAAAEGEKAAGRKRLAAFADSIKSQMILLAAKETALGIANAAGIVTAGLAGPHFAAAAQATAVAAIAGVAGATISQTIPDTATGSGGGEGGASLGGDSTAASSTREPSETSSKSRGGNEAQEVPISRPPVLDERDNLTINVNIGMLVADDEEAVQKLGRKLRNLSREAA